MAAISLHHVVKRYRDGSTAVNDVSLEIADGELVILVGPSGCGKSTLLRMIVGLEELTSGEVCIGGRRVNELSPRERNLAMVFQNYALYPHLSVFENIAFPLRIQKRLGEPALRDKVENAARRLGLSELLERKPSQLSGGQRQRVAMGRALVREPNAFLFDEPLSNLDARLRAQMRTEIARLQRELGVTTVYVTHDQTEALTLGDRVAVLEHGLLRQLGEPRELYERPASLFVAGFIGSPAMNLVRARVEQNALVLPFARVQLSETRRARVGEREAVIAGIRPEHVALAASPVEQREGAAYFDATIDVVEWLGNQQFAHLGSLDHELIVALDPELRVAEGSSAHFSFQQARVHLFDPDTGENLTRDLPAS